MHEREAEFERDLYIVLVGVALVCAAFLLWPF